MENENTNEHTETPDVGKSGVICVKNVVLSYISFISSGSHDNWQHDTSVFMGMAADLTGHVWNQLWDTF